MRPAALPFELVPEHFPRAVGSVTGLVGLGGFFPPLVLGAIRQATGSFTWRFVFLAAFSLGCLAVCRVTTARPPRGLQPAA